MNFNRKDKIEIVENAISWIIVFAMFVYGGAKVIQFDGASEIDKTVSEMTGMELMWAFYGYSKSYAIIIGLFEVIGALLILFNKTRILGAIVLTTILVNVILQDIFYSVNQGALQAAIIYQAIIFCIIYLRRVEVISTLKYYFQQVKSTERSWKRKALIAVCSIIIAFSLKLVEAFLTH